MQLPVCCIKQFRSRAFSVKRPPKLYMHEHGELHIQKVAANP